MSPAELDAKREEIGARMAAEISTLLGWIEENLEACPCLAVGQDCICGFESSHS